MLSTQEKEVKAKYISVDFMKMLHNETVSLQHKRIKEYQTLKLESKKN